MNVKKAFGGFLYLLGLALGFLRPPIERLACMKIPSGEACTGINMPLLAVELGFIMAGALLMGLGHGFKNPHELNGWLGVAIGLGTAFVGGYSGIWVVFLFGVSLATLGLLVYKVGRVKHAHG
ncbi:hypothetical protein FH039_11075 [Thermococcus indicus]|uniref:Uncharacterized protein n=2 Tax=Thermococcus indicus TaxID=2586643 RepID=A0A4Y5SQB4_9EURY|nr:hypothetical protein [Thermococcus indicus]QDA32544.1 hypothetical protein FH039_11075 [Thermococcus indicus]